MTDVLIFDGDDTLWPCNTVFEHVLTLWLDWIDPDHARHDELRQLVHDVDTRRITKHQSYGTTGFITALQASLAHARGRPPGSADLRHVETLAAPLHSRTADPLPGVPDTLSVLAEQHPLILLTRGDPTEQNRLLDSSGLRRYFRAVHITPDKTPTTYTDLTAQHSLDPATTWMIGNSARSDILPARTAGLRAIHIPSPSLWHHDHADLDPHDPGITTLLKFSDLLTLFPSSNTPS